MKILSLIIILSSILLSNEVEIKLNPTLNKTTNYQALVKNHQKSNGQMINNTLEYKFSNTLIENTVDGMLFSWKIISISSEENLKGVSKELENINEGLEIKFYTTQSGIYKSVDNWDEILEFFETKLQKIEDDFWGDPQAKQSVSALKKSLLKPEQLSEYLLQEINLIHNFYGAKIELNNQTTNTMMIPDDYLSISLPILHQSKLELKNNKYIFEVNEKIDQLRSNKIIKDYATENNLEAIQYSNSQDFRFIYDSNFKLLNLEYVKSVKINNDELEKYIIISIDK